MTKKPLPPILQSLVYAQRSLNGLHDILRIHEDIVDPHWGQYVDQVDKMRDALAQMQLELDGYDQIPF